MLLATTAVISTAEAFRGPAGTALTPKVLGQEYYEYGMSLMSTLSSAVELAGTLAAAGIIAVIGVAGAIYLDMVTFLLSAGILCFVNTREQDMVRRKFDGKTYFTDLREGFTYVRKSREVCYLLLIVLFLNGILVPLNSLQAPMTEEILHGGAQMLSVLSVALTVGMLLGSVTYPAVKKYVTGKQILLLSAGVIALFYIGLPVLEPFFHSGIFRYLVLAVFSAALGYAASAAGTFLSVASVKWIDQDYLARTSGIMSAGSIAATPVLSFLISGVVSALSTSQCFLIAGGCAVLEGIWIAMHKNVEEK